MRRRHRKPLHHVARATGGGEWPESRRKAVGALPENDRIDLRAGSQYRFATMQIDWTKSTFLEGISGKSFGPNQSGPPLESAGGATEDAASVTDAVGVLTTVSVFHCFVAKAPALVVSSWPN